VTSWVTGASFCAFEIIIASDDLRPSLSCYGDKLVKTPNIDKLAREGTVCSNWYSDAPVCAPARSALLTGRYPLRAGVGQNGHPLRASEKTIAAVLKEAGHCIQGCRWIDNQERRGNRRRCRRGKLVRLYEVALQSPQYLFQRESFPLCDTSELYAHSHQRVGGAYCAFHLHSDAFHLQNHVHRGPYRECGSQFDVAFRRSLDGIDWADPVAVTDTPDADDVEPHPLVGDSAVSVELYWGRDEPAGSLTHDIVREARVVVNDSIFADSFES